MRVLIAHRWYGTVVPSGEDRAVEEDIRELTDAGVEVFCSMPEGAGPSPGGLEPSSRYSRYSPVEIVKSGARLLDRVQPDLVHLHNPYPEYMALVRELGRRDGIPLVHTIHNHRHVCPAGSAFRDGHACTDCATERFPVSAVRHRCVNGSAVKSLAMGTMVRLGGRSVDAADLRIAVSEHLARRLEADSRPGDGPVAVLHNAVRDPLVASEAPSATALPPGPFIFFAGRLNESKGVDLLLDAFSGVPASNGVHLVVAGEGPMREQVLAAAATDPRIRFVGQVGSAQAHGWMAASSAVVVPSVWDEPFGLTAAEALGCGVPVIVTDRGALPEVVGDQGIVVTATVDGLRDGLAAVEAEPSAEVRRLARGRWETMFSPQTRGPALLSLYQRALGRDT